MTEPTSSAGRESSPGQPALVLGAILVVVGLILFAGQMVDIGFGDLGWPLWILAVGVAIVFIGLFVMTEPPIVVMGTVVTTLGAVLLYQEATGNWQTWAYAWALVGPAASGLGMLLWGLRRGDAGTVRGGFWGMLGGLAFFVVGFIFFEGIIGLSDLGLALPEWSLPVAVIAIGVVVLLRGLFSGPRRPEADAA